MGISRRPALYRIDTEECQAAAAADATSASHRRAAAAETSSAVSISDI